MLTLLSMVSTESIPVMTMLDAHHVIPEESGQQKHKHTPKTSEGMGKKAQSKPMENRIQLERRVKHENEKKKWRGIISKVN